MRAIPWEETLAKLSPEVRAAIQREAEVHLLAMALESIATARKLSPEEMYDRISNREKNSTSLDQRFEVRIETLREVIEAMGGELCITARFPDAEYPIGSFNPVRAPDPPDEDFIAAAP